MGLKAHLDDAWSDVPVWVLGDWNDDVDESISSGRDTPYRVFVDAAPAWVFPTAALSAAGIRSMPRYEDPVDHILASDEAMVWFEEGSATALPLHESIPAYIEAASDHLPVLTRFRIGG